MIRPSACFALFALAMAGCSEKIPSGNGIANDSATNAVPSLLRSQDPPVPKNLPDIVRVRIETSAGTIVVALDHKHAPITTTNFVRYADGRRFDGTSFYRTVRDDWAPKQGFIQGGIANRPRLGLAPIRLEPTSETGLHHRDGTISMAHSTPDTAMGDFILCVGAQPDLDAKPGKTDEDKGFAAFGQVVQGMDVVRRILAAPTVTYGGKPSENIAAPVRIIRVMRAG